MNERIKELAEQAEEWVCKNYPDAMDDSDEFHAQTMEKFAELIVAECIDVVGKSTASPTGYQALMKHFGVEE